MRKSQMVKAGEKRAAVIYCRVSTKDQVENLSLGLKEKHCRAYCGNEGLAVDRVFIDEGESAKTAERPEFQKLLAYCGENKKRIGHMVVYSVSRFARNQHDHVQTVIRLRELSICLRSATEPIGDSVVGRAMEGMLAVFAQMDNDQRAERTVAGMEEALRSGAWTFEAPIGYLNAKEAGGRREIVPDPESAQFVQRAFEMYASGKHGKRAILRHLNAEGFRNRHGRPVTAQTLDRILCNEFYTGWMNAFEMRARGKYEPLISEQLFAAAQAVRSGKRLTAWGQSRNRAEFPLRGFLLCGCGRKLTASFSKGRALRYGYYHCAYCKAASAPLAHMEKKFLALLARLQPTPELVGSFGEAVVTTWRRRQEWSAQRCRGLESKVAKLRLLRNTLMDAWLEKRVCDRDYFERKASFDSEIGGLELALEETRSFEEQIEPLVEFAREVMRNPAGIWLESSLEHRQRFQALLFPGGLIFKDGELGTDPSPCFFTYLAQFPPDKTSLASPTGFEPVLSP